jgi:CubicO group peptidase (beta-lactamase class C family)
MKRWRIDGRISRRSLIALLAVSLSVLALERPAVARAAPKPRAAWSQEKLDRVGAYIENEIQSAHIPGAVILIQQHGKPVYFRMFGVRDIIERHPMTPDTIFRLYSMSKPITSAAVMMLIDDGKLRLGDPVAKYIPAFAKTRVGIDGTEGNGQPTLRLEPPDRPITIRDLLLHTSGITYGFYGADPARQRYSELDLVVEDWDNAEFADRIAKLPLAEQPGTLWDYGHSTDVLGRVVEVVSGQSLYQFEKQRLLDPLGMRDTSFYVTDKTKWPRIAQPMPDDRLIAPFVPITDPTKVRRWESGGGGMVGTVGDYAKFCQMMLNGGVLSGRRYLHRKTVAAMIRDHIGPGSGIKRDYYYFPGDGFGFGYGFAVRTKLLAERAGPLGEYRWDGVGGTFFWVDPKDDMFVVFMVQTPNERGRIQQDLRQLIYDALRR